jgi:DNA-binding SARP family transcriptional activator
MEELKLSKYENDPEKSIVHYLNAASIYTGDFLEEDLYSDWITEARERFKREYLQAIHNIIEYFDRKRDYEKCIEYARKYVDKDIYAEDIYQLLMIYYAKIGNKAMVIKTFQRCKENIENELDGPLSKETVKLYKKLISNSSAS